MKLKPIETYKLNSKLETELKFLSGKLEMQADENFSLDGILERIKSNKRIKKISNNN